MEEDILEEADDEKRDITEGEERLVMRQGTGEDATMGDDIIEEDDDDGVILREKDEDTIGLNSGQVTNKLLELISSRKIKVTQHKEL